VHTQTRGALADLLRRVSLFLSFDRLRYIFSTLKKKKKILVPTVILKVEFQSERNIIKVENDIVGRRSALELTRKLCSLRVRDAL